MNDKNMLLEEIDDFLCDNMKFLHDRIREDLPQMNDVDFEMTRVIDDINEKGVENT